MAKVTMPQLGESVAEGTIGKWLKQPGDHVDKYEPLVEVITDKVNAEVPSPFEGMLREILAEEGATVPNNAEIAVIETADDGAAHAGHGAGVGPPAGADARSGRLRRPPAPRRAGRRPPARPAAADRAPAAARPRPRPADPDARMTPAVRRLLREHELVARPGRGHRRRRPDHPRGRARVVEAIRTGSAGPGRGRPRRQRQPPPHRPPRLPAPRPRPRRPAPPIVFPDGADEVLVPMTRMRKGIAAQMTRALAVPHAYVHIEVDASGLVRAREAAKRDYQAREGISLSYVPFVIKAAVEALRRNPTFNAHWTDAGPRRQAAHPHGRRGGRRRRPASCRSSATSTSSRSAASTAPSPTSPPAPAPASSASTTTAAARSRSTTPAGSART